MPETERPGDPFTIIQLAGPSVGDAFEQIARLHTAHIHHGILPKLGMRFLARLYTELSRGPNAGVWAATRGSEIVGFLAGCADVRGTYVRLLTRPAFLLDLAVGVMGARALGVGRLMSPMTYLAKRRTADAAARSERECPAELLAIALAPAARGRGLGRKLVAAFEERLRRWPASACYRVSTNASDADSNAFYRALGLTAREQVRHHDLVLQVYQKIL